MRSPSQWLLLGVALAAIAARPTIAADLRDLYFGEALYQAYQGQYFDALERLDAELAQHRHLDEPELDSLQHHIRQAAYPVGAIAIHHKIDLGRYGSLCGDLEDVVAHPLNPETALCLALTNSPKAMAEIGLHA